VLDRDRIETRISGLIQIQRARLDQPMPAADGAGAQQSQADRLALRRAAQQTWPAGCRHGGKQGPDPLPRGEKGRPGHRFERSPFAFESAERRQRLTAELDRAGHPCPLAARGLFRNKTTLKLYQASRRKLDLRLIPA